MKKQLQKSILITFLAFIGWNENTNAQWVKTSFPAIDSIYNIGQNNWSKCTVSISCFAVGNSTVYGGAGQYCSNGVSAGKGIYSSSDNGGAWTRLNPASNAYLKEKEVLAILVDGANIYAGTKGNGADGGIYISKDNGITWNNEADVTLKGIDIRALVKSGTKIFAGGKGGTIYLSSDNGTTWTAKGSPGKINALAVSGNTLLAANNGGGITLSTDDGATWTAVNTGIPNYSGYFVDQIAVCGADLFAGMFDEGVYKSSNNGSTWTLLSTSVPLKKIVSLLVDGNTIYVGSSKGLFFSTDQGASWTKSTTGFPQSDYSVGAIAKSGSNIFASTGDGVWMLSLSASSGINDIDQKNRLNIYPNPATELLAVELSEYKNTTAEIFNMEGQLLQSTSLQTSITTMNINRLVSGLYLLKIKGAGGITVRKFAKE